jgi:hypothetical protein
MIKNTMKTKTNKNEEENNEEIIVILYSIFRFVLCALCFVLCALCFVLCGVFYFIVIYIIKHYK